MRRLEIVVENAVDELLSFPLEQSIRLLTSEPLEDSSIESKITLLRNITEQGILNHADLYNYNIGYVKEKFSTVPLDITIQENRVTVKPKEVLHPGSSYTLFLDKNISREFISIEKTVSKGPSKLELVSHLDGETLKVYKLKVVSDPLITAKNNIVKLQLTVDGSVDKTFTVDAKSVKNTITFYGFVVKVLDTAYGRDEEFTITMQDSRVNLKENLVVNINTVLNTEIKPADNASVSQGLSQQDILDYYNKSAPVESTLTQADIDKDVRLEYVGYNKAILHLDKLTVDQLDFQSMEVLEFPAYNRYDLEEKGLYNCEQQFCIDYKLLDDKTVLLEFKEMV